MTTDLAVIEPLPLPTATQPMPQLPPWIRDMEQRIRLNYQPDSHGKWAERMTLKVMPTDEQRAMLEKYRASYARFREAQMRVDGKSAHVLTAAFVLALPVPRDANTDSEQARLLAFKMALDDVPLQALKNAIYNWHHKNCGWWEYGTHHDFDYHWCPSPAELRSIAMREVSLLRDHTKDIDRILSCVPYVEWQRPPLDWTPRPK